MLHERVKLGIIIEYFHTPFREHRNSFRKSFSVGFSIYRIYGYVDSQFDIDSSIVSVSLRSFTCLYIYFFFKLLGVIKGRYNNRSNEINIFSHDYVIRCSRVYIHLDTYVEVYFLLINPSYKVK